MSKWTREEDLRLSKIWGMDHDHVQTEFPNKTANSLRTRAHRLGLNQREREWEITVFIPDCHYPYHDTASIAAVMNLVADIRPDRIVQLGDLMDFYPLSFYDRNPRRLLSLQDEIDSAESFWANLRQIAPNAELMYREGNHELRLQRRLWQNPELTPLRALSIPELLHLEDHNVRFFPYHSRMMLYNNQLMVIHGSIVRPHSGYSAQGELQRTQMSGISGHVHRLGMVFFTSENGTRVWVEGGHLASPDAAEYIVGTPNWQQGVTVGYFSQTSNRFHMVPVPIIHNSFLFNGKFYSAEGIN